jgi:AmiR/NasT family two-component response regulator
MRRTIGFRTNRPPARWRVGILDADARSRVEVARVIEAGGGMVVVDSPPRPDSADLLRHMEPDALVVAVDDVANQCDEAASEHAFDLPVAVVLLTSAGRARKLRAARTPGVMGVLFRPLRPEEVWPTLDIAWRASATCGGSGGSWRTGRWWSRPRRA